MNFQKIVYGAFSTVHEHRASLAKAIAIPFCTYLAIESTAYLDQPDYVHWVLATLGVMVYAIMAITTHRVILLGPDSVPEWGIRSLSKREINFILYALGMFLLLVALLPLIKISVVVTIVAFLLMCWFVPRFFLVFPGIAVDRGVTLKESWELTKNHQLHMFLIVILFPVLLGTPLVLLEFLPYGLFLSNLISTLIIVVEVAALSLTYQHITRDVYGDTPLNAVSSSIALSPTKKGLIAILALLVIPITVYFYIFTYIEPDSLTLKYFDEKDPAVKLQLLEEIMDRGDYETWSWSDNAAKLAYKIGDYDKAENYASRSLTMSRDHVNDWNYGNVIHNSNVVLGRIRLSEGDIEQAKYHLLEAAKSEGSPQLNTYGPKLELANDLLQRGERDAVVGYLNEVSTFWEMDHGCVKRWLSEIEQGETPKLCNCSCR